MHCHGNKVVKLDKTTQRKGYW